MLQSVPQKVKVKVKVILQPIVSRPVHVDVRHPSGTRDQFFFLLEIFFRQLRVCYFVASSLTRGWVCNLLLLLVLASAVPLGSESHGTQDHILLSQFLRLPQPGGPGPYIYVLQEQGGPDIKVKVKVKAKVILQLKSVGQSILMSGTHLGPATNFSHSLFDYFLDSFGFVDVGLPVWWEVGSILFSFCWASPVQLSQIWVLQDSWA
jgi:hypothetical protein